MDPGARDGIRQHFPAAPGPYPDAEEHVVDACHAASGNAPVAPRCLGRTLPRVSPGRDAKRNGRLASRGGGRCGPRRDAFREIKQASRKLEALVAQSCEMDHSFFVRCVAENELRLLGMVLMYVAVSMEWRVDWRVVLVRADAGAGWMGVFVLADSRPLREPYLGTSLLPSGRPEGSRGREGGLRAGSRDGASSAYYQKNLDV